MQTILPKSSGYLAGDYNGDGRQDVLNVSTNKTYGMNNKGTEFNILWNCSFGGGFLDEYQTGDFNGDGKANVVRLYTSSSKTFGYYESTGSGFSNVDSIGSPTGYGTEKILAGDFNGDGISDLLTYVPLDESKKVFWGDEEEPFSDSTNLSIEWYDEQYCYDFNGNGKTEILILSSLGCSIYEWDEDSFDEIYASNDYKSTYTYFFGDYNGDGKTDFIKLKHWLLNEYKMYSCISNGDDFTETFMEDTIKNPYGFYVFDSDGDGRDELVLIPADPIPEDGYVYDYKDGSFDKGYINFSTGYLTPVLYNDFDGDGLVECLYGASDNYMRIANFVKENYGSYVSSIIDGFNNAIAIGYKSLTDSTVHTMQTDGQYPIVDYGSFQYVVSDIEYDNGLGGAGKTSFFYKGAKLDKQRGGFLGFKEFTRADSISEIKTVNYFSVDSTFYFPFVDSSLIMTLEEGQIAKTEFEYSVTNYGNKRYFAYVSQTSNTDYLHGLESLSTFEYDTYGNVIGSTSAAGSASSETDYTYVNQGSWCLNRPDTVTTTISRTGEDDFTSTIRYQYESGLLKYKVGQEGDTNQIYTLFPEYDDFGNPLQVMISPDSIHGRNIYYEYDVKGRMVTKIKNDLEDSAVITNDYGWGVVTQTEDQNGLVTEYTFDEFGRNTKTDFPDGTSTETETGWAVDDNQLFSVRAKASGSGDVIKYFDSLGREILAKTVNVNGDSVFVNIAYNNKGQLSYITLPYFKGESNSAKKIITYDDYGRVTAERSPGACMKYSYSGKTVTILDSIKNMSVTREIDSTGIITKSTDGAGDITYSYYANGLVKGINSLGISTSMEYDKFGRQTKLVDPNAGTMRYGYNPYGQLITQTDALNRITSLAYDTLGRVVTRNEEAFNTSWTYNQDGTLKKMAGTHGLLQKYQYDDTLRIESATDSIGNQQLTTRFEYDTNGRISKLTYPSGFSVTYHYQNGYLQEIKRGDNSASIWKLDDVNALGQITAETYGNGLESERTYDENGYLETIVTGPDGNVQDLEYIYNSKGQMYQRIDHRHSSITETFSYDNLNRLTMSLIDGDTAFAVDYQDNGNIDSKSDLGDYYYNASHPHAVESVDCYDSIQYTMQDVSYTSFNMADTITQGDFTIVFTYGTDYARKKTATTIESNQTTRYYSGAYEKIVTSSQTRELHYIGAYGRLVALYEITDGEDSAMYYVHTDHLGSVNCITNANDSIVQETSFTTWGRRRDPVTWEVLDTIPANLITSRGYTGHEHIDEFNLINMNGRIYDPVLCRFLSPDPFVANPGFSQDYNRYSYVLNNPIAFTDPSGYLRISMDLMKLIAELWFRPDNYFGGTWSVSDGWHSFSYSESMSYAEDYKRSNSGVQYDLVRVRTNTMRFHHRAGKFKYYTAGDGLWHYNKDDGYTYSWVIRHIPVISDWLNDDSRPDINPANFLAPDAAYQIAANGGGPGWEAYAGAAASAASEMYYSKTYGTWMGKNFKMYKQTWGGNGIAGGKNKFGKSTSNAIKWGGRIVGAYSGYKTIEQRVNGEIGTGWMVAELGTTGVSTFGGLYGAAWGVGWELGRAVTTLDAYQEFKFNFWYNRWESQVGPPSQSNEGAWYYFYQNYGR